MKLVLTSARTRERRSNLERLCGDYVSYGEARGYVELCGRSLPRGRRQGRACLAMHTSCVRKVEEVAGAALSDQAALGGAVGFGRQCKKNAPEFNELGARRGGDSV